MFHCIASALHQPGPKGKVYLVTVQKQKLISQCLIVTQFSTPWYVSLRSLVEIVLLLHIYCTNVLVAKFFYSTYICQLWMGDSKQISDKAIKGLICVTKIEQDEPLGSVFSCILKFNRFWPSSLHWRKTMGWEEVETRWDLGEWPGARSGD